MTGSVTCEQRGRQSRSHAHFSMDFRAMERLDSVDTSGRSFGVRSNESRNGQMFCCKVVAKYSILLYSFKIQNNKILVKIVNKQENISKLQSNDVIQYVKLVRCNEGRTIKVLVWDHVTFLQSVIL